MPNLRIYKYALAIGDTTLDLPGGVNAKGGAS